MKQLFFFSLILLLSLGAYAARSSTSEISIIPKPVSVVQHKGTYLLKDKLTVFYPVGDSILGKAARFIAAELSNKTGLALEVSTTLKAQHFLTLTRWNTKYKEAYTLNIGATGVKLRAADYNGALYGMQSVIQLLPAAVYGINKSKQYTLPCVKIVDYPRFSYRGMHLDVSRHFYNGEEVKQYLDYIAMHKMNVFHWHLTDDQGWRMESKKYPLLTQISAWRVDRLKDDWRSRQPIQAGEKASYGGFYTQEEIKEIVAYAGARGIEVIPEIELPGHSSEVFAAYPNLSCIGKKQEVSPGGYYKDLQTCFCAGNEDAFTFLQDILEETMALFPSKYIHIGADEVNKSFWKKCPKCKKRMDDEGLKNVDELQSYFVKRMEKFINSKGKNLIGWDEIIEGGLAPNATVMSWRGISGGIEGAKSGHDVIMTPETFLYYDYYQDLPENEPVAIGGLNTLKTTYDFDPIPEELTHKEAKHILGAQANVWCEWITTFDHIQYMILPRMTALSEVVWSPKDARNYSDFGRRLETQRLRFAEMGVRSHAPTSLVDIQATKSGHGFVVTMAPETYKAQVHYTLDGSEPSLLSPLYSKPLQLKKPTLLKAKAYHPSWQDSPVFTRAFGRHLAYDKKVTLVSPSTGRHSALPEQLVDGMTATFRYPDKGYQCVYGKNFEAIIDLEKPTQIKQISGSFLYYAPNRIHLPKEFEVYVSLDGKNYVKMGSAARGLDPFSCKSAKQMLEVNTDCLARYIKVIGVNEVIPDGLVGAGKMPGILCDEIFVY